MICVDLTDVELIVALIMSRSAILCSLKLVIWKRFRTWVSLRDLISTSCIMNNYLDLGIKGGLGSSLSISDYYFAVAYSSQRLQFAWMDESPIEMSPDLELPQFEPEKVVVANCTGKFQTGWFYLWYSLSCLQKRLRLSPRDSFLTY